ncbi:peptidase M48 [Mycolicibacterium conceptionense]|uniref:Peptidase M48 n=2 Tax=Mycolicibacterium TaxID=1866885 RepID=A0ABR5FRP2_9MYCO|nr:MULTISPECIES: M56 family metallopeptidase [Mycolicibacterium]KLI08126.1 peptidase M48 [Mycolicibacterium senegalense]KLO50480.1 peptidase M48 [Mycolicibacterium senegalense]KMV18641.1 peptidase M48 [Mycolicibacterium conceptionense]OBK09351.1 peptidase M48 [Mycolicibacterium conceptionense]OMB80735.1 peptidase M48 [Mycolicibacterium conceptionense]
MNIAAGLLIYSAAMVLLAPRLLSMLTRGGSAPRFGVAAWLTAIISVLAIWIAIPALVIGDVVSHTGQRKSLLASCVELLCDVAAGRAGFAAQATVVIGAVTVIAMFIGFGVKASRAIRQMRAHAHSHAQAVRLVGRPGGQRDVFIVDSDERTAYCVAGAPPAIVVTTGTIAALDSDELQAVLAHERAHLDGHHPKIVTVLRGLAIVFPRVKLMTRGAAEVARLLEMCADDAAARRFGERTLLTGLMALAGATPAQALGAADVALLNRAERLALPPAPWVRLGARAGLFGAITVIALAPIATFAMGVSGLLCR